jgi:hypothetical protein
MNLSTGFASFALALLMIWMGRPNKEGLHPKWLRFQSALVLYPPVILAFIAFGVAGIISGSVAK